MRWLALLVLAACASPPPAAAPPAAHPHAHSHAHHRFDDAERWSQVFDDPARDAWQQPDKVVEMLALQPGMIVADVGAGTGYFLPRLSRAVGPDGRVLGLDIEEAMVKHMTERAAKEGLANVSARQVTPDDPGLGDGVDRVLIVDTWHHIGQREAYAARLREGLRAGGFVLVVDFKKESKLGPPVEAKLDPATVIAELRAGGLEPIEVEGALPEQFVILARK